MTHNKPTKEEGSLILLPLLVFCILEAIVTTIGKCKAEGNKNQRRRKTKCQNGKKRQRQ